MDNKISKDISSKVIQDLQKIEWIFKKVLEEKENGNELTNSHSSRIRN